MELSEADLEKGAKVTEYFLRKYGPDKAKFIISRIGSSVRQFDLTTMIELGEKIAFFNRWTTDAGLIDKLHEMNKDQP